MWWRKYFFLSVLALCLSACTTTTFKPAQDPQQAWQSYQQVAVKQQAWHIHGVLGVVNQKHAFSGAIDWLQQDKQYQINLYGPLGVGATQLKGTLGGQVTLSTQGKQYHAHDAAALMQQQLGWHVPVSGLIYWVRGLPLPGVAHEQQLNVFGFLAYLEQQGWQIRYMGYMHTQGGTVLPQKLKMKRGQLTLTLVVDHWR